MPKNVSGGNKTKKQKSMKKKIIVADELCDNQLFGVIKAKHGGGFFSVLCSDKVMRRGRLGPMLRENRNPEARIMIGGYVIAELRECDSKDERCDIITIAKPPKSVCNIFKDDEEFENDDLYREGNDEDNFNDNNDYSKI